MRITHQQLTRNHIKRMNVNLKNLTSSNDKMTTQRAYNKSYENVHDAGLALKVRKLVVDNQRYQDTIRDVEGRARTAEDHLRTVNGLLINAKDRIVEGLNGTLAPEDRQKIGAEIEKFQDEIFLIMNAKHGDNYIFGASGNADSSAPFTKDAGGNLLYNGTRVDAMVKGPGGKPALQVDDGFGGFTYEAIPYNADNYVDIGFDFGMVGGKVDPNTAFKDTYSGVECFGYGVDAATGMPLNAYSLFGEIKNSLNGNDLKTLDKCLNALPRTMDYLLTTITDIGARGVTLENTAARLEKEYVNLTERQNKLEGIDLAGEAINNKDFEMSWLVTLQLGSKILPQSIFDFMR